VQIPAGPTTIKLQIPQVIQQGSQVQYTTPAAQQTVPASSQLGQGGWRKNQRPQQNSVRNPSAEDMTNAPSGDGINNPGVLNCFSVLFVLAGKQCPTDD
jgi:hypothetical protein